MYPRESSKVRAVHQNGFAEQFGPESVSDRKHRITVNYEP